MICPSSPESVQNARLAMTPDQDHTYTPASSRPSHQDFLFDWPTTSATSEAEFSSLSSEPFSPDRPCGLGLFLPSFDIEESYHPNRESWHSQQSGVHYGSPSAITTSGLPIVEPKCLTTDPLYENNKLLSTSLPGTPWHVLQTTFPGTSHILSPSCSNYSIPSRPSPMSSPIAQARRPRAFSSDDVRGRTLDGRKKRKYTTQENARLSCQVCGKLFQRKFNQRKHMETHQPTRVRPFTCEYEECNKSFARRTDLARHEKSVSVRLFDLLTMLTTRSCICKCAITCVLFVMPHFRAKTR